jgi:hypothetical protein
LQTGLGGLELLIPTPNYLDAQRTGNHVEANRAYALNPAASSPAHLRQYEFLGILIGCALRTHVLMPFNLPNTVWRFLVGLPLRRVDLLQVDKRVYDTLNSIATCAHAQAFDELIHHTLALDRPLVEEEDHKNSNSNKHSNKNNSNKNNDNNDNNDNAKHQPRQARQARQPRTVHGDPPTTLAQPAQRSFGKPSSDTTGTDVLPVVVRVVHVAQRDVHVCLHDHRGTIPQLFCNPATIGPTSDPTSGPTTPIDHRRLPVPGQHAPFARRHARDCQIHGRHQFALLQGLHGIMVIVLRFHHFPHEKRHWPMPRHSSF